MHNCTTSKLNTESEQSIHTCKTSKPTTKFVMNGRLHMETAHGDLGAECQEEEAGETGAGRQYACLSL